MSPEIDQNASDVEAATGTDKLPEGHPGSDETTADKVVDNGDGSVTKPDGTVEADNGVPTGAATSVDPTVATPPTAAASTQDGVGSDVPVTVVAPNAAGSEPFINPDPDSAISEPPKVDAQGKVVPVIAPANQPSPVSPQVEAQKAAQKDAEEPPTIQELAACANALRSGMMDHGGLKVAALLDRVTQKRIEQDESDLHENDEKHPGTTV